MRNIVVLGGSSHPQLTQAICDRLAIKPAQVHISTFSNGETNVEIVESVRDRDVFVIQSEYGKVNNQLMELLIMISACKIASARKITVVLPLFPYSRQAEGPYKRNGMPLNRLTPEACHKLAEMQHLPFPHTYNHKLDSEDGSKQGQSPSPPMSKCSPATSPLKPATPDLTFGSTPNRTANTPGSSLNEYVSSAAGKMCAPQTTRYKVWAAKPGTLIADMLVSAGAQHIVTLDMHHPQFQGFFNIPVDNLQSFPLMYKYIVENIPDWKNAVIVSPDAGGAKRATAIAEALNIPFALIHKDRRAGMSSSLTLVGNVKDKIALIVDDIVDTCHTSTRAAHVLTANGARQVLVLATHGIMSGEAIKRLVRSPINSLIVSNSVPQFEHVNQAAADSGQKDKIIVYDIAPIFAECIRRVYNGESVSFLYDVVPIVH